jgi:glutathione S-transferase
MADYDLYYWSVPFRGQFVRALLGFAGRSWNEPGDAATEQLMQRPAREMPVPFMGPPVLEHFHLGWNRVFRNGFDL